MYLKGYLTQGDNEMHSWRAVSRYSWVFLLALFNIF